MNIFEKLMIGLPVALLSACGVGGVGGESIRDPDIDSLFSCGQYLQAKVMDPGGTSQAVGQTMQIIASALDDSREIHQWYKTAGLNVAQREIRSVMDEYCVEYPRDGINDAVISGAEIVYDERQDDPMFHNCSRLNSGRFNDQDLLRAAELTDVPEEMVHTTELLANIKTQCQERPTLALRDQVKRLESIYHQEVRSLKAQAEQAEAGRVYDAFIVRFEDVKDRVGSMALPNGDLRCDVYIEAMGMLDEAEKMRAGWKLVSELRQVMRDAVETHRQLTNSDTIVQYPRDYSAATQEGFPGTEYCRNNNLNAYYEAIRAERQAQQDAEQEREQARYEEAVANNQAMEEMRQLHMQWAEEAERERRIESERQQAEIDRQQEEAHMRAYGRPMRTMRDE